MAVEYTIHEGRWSARRLRAALDDWAASAPEGLSTRSPMQNTTGGLWNWFFAEGSVRGCSLLLAPPALMKHRALRIRLNLMASNADWQLAFALMRMLIAAGGGRATDPDGQPMRRQALGESDAGSEALAHLRADAQSVARPLREGKPFLALPNPEFSLIVVPALLSAERDEGRFAHALGEELTAMSRRYMDADRIPFVSLPDGTNLSVWHQGEALVYLTRYIATTQSGEAADGIVLPGKDLIAALGDRVETVSEDHDRFYLPALEPGRPEDAKVLAQIAQDGEPLEPWLARFKQVQTRQSGLGALLGNAFPTGPAR